MGGNEGLNLEKGQMLTPKFADVADYFPREQNPKPANTKVDLKTVSNSEGKGGGTLQLGSNRGKLVAIIAIPSAAVIVFIVVVITIWFWKRRPRRPDNRLPEVLYAAATQEDGDGTSDDRGQRSPIALMSGLSGFHCTLLSFSVIYNVFYYLFFSCS